MFDFLQKNTTNLEETDCFIVSLSRLVAIGRHKKKHPGLQVVSVLGGWTFETINVRCLSAPSSWNSHGSTYLKVKIQLLYMDDAMIIHHPIASVSHPWTSQGPVSELKSSYGTLSQDRETDGRLMTSRLNKGLFSFSTVLHALLAYIFDLIFY